MQITERFMLCDLDGSGLISFDGLAYIVQHHDPRCIFEAHSSEDGLREMFCEIQALRGDRSLDGLRKVGLYDILDWVEHLLNETREFDRAARTPDALRWLLWRRSTDTRTRLLSLSRASAHLAQASEPMRLA